MLEAAEFQTTDQPPRGGVFGHGGGSKVAESRLSAFLTRADTQLESTALFQVCRRGDLGLCSFEEAIGPTGNPIPARARARRVFVA
jgi:hypothetical protein